MTLIGVRNVLS